VFPCLSEKKNEVGAFAEGLEIHLALWPGANLLQDRRTDAEIARAIIGRHDPRDIALIGYGQFGVSTIGYFLTRK